MASKLLEVENTLYSTLERALGPMREENAHLRAELAALKTAPTRHVAAPVSVAVPTLAARAPAPRPEPPPEMQPPAASLSSREEAVRACRTAARQRGAKALKHQAALLDRKQADQATAACEAARAPGQRQLGIALYRPIFAQLS